MVQEQTAAGSKKCDACQKDITQSEVRYMPLKTCCKTEQIPLCKECWQKFAAKR